MTNFGRLLVDFSSLSLANLGGRVLLIVSAVITAYYVGPYYLGVLGILLLVLNWGVYFHFGLLDGLLKILPEERGRGNNERVEELRRIGFSVNLLMAVILVCLILVASLFPENPDLANGLAVASVLLLLQQTFRYLYICMVTENRFQRIGVLVFSGTLLRVLLAIALVIVLPLKYKFYGPLVGMGVAFLAQIWVESARQRPRVRLHFPRSEAVVLFRAGWPITMYGLLLVVLYTADKIFIVSHLGLTEAGYYELGSRVREIIGFFLASFFTVILPRGLELYSKTGERGSVRSLFYGPLAVNSHFYPLLMAAIILWLPPFVGAVLPKFIPGIASMKVLTVGGFFLALSYVPAGILVVLDRQKKLLYLLSGSITIYLILVGIVLTLGGDIIGVAVAAVISYFIYGTAVMVYAHSQFEGRLFSYLRLFGNYLPGVYALLLLLALPRLWLWLAPEGSEWVRAAGVNLLFLLFYSPVLLWAEKKLGVLRELRSIVSRRVPSGGYSTIGEGAE
jgi:O-antigen/teichoic acid export membrane protein